MYKKLIIGIFLVSTVFGRISASAEPVRCDVLVVSATPAGVAAAVAAGRSGLDVVLLEETTHVGGIITAGLTNADIVTHKAIRGLFEEYRQRIVRHYIETYGDTSDEYHACHRGYHVQPGVAERVFRDMLESTGRVRVIERHRVVAATVADAEGREKPADRGKRLDGAVPEPFGPPCKLVAVTAENLAEPGSRTEFRAKVFVDATYEGDLAALAGVPYRVGRESRNTFGEKYAGKVYLRFGEKELLPGSTGEADDGIQAFCFRFHVTDKKDNMVPIEKPDDYNRDDYRDLIADFEAGKVTELRQVLQFYRMPGGNFEINSNHPDPQTGVPSESLDLAEENWHWPEADHAERAKFFRRNWNHNEGLFWFLQHDSVVPEKIRNDAFRYGFPKNEFVDNRHRPHLLYVRQGRRIWGEYNFTEKDADADPETKLARRHPDGIAVAEFPIDSHGVTKYDPAYPRVREGYFFVTHPATQIPYGVLVPKRVDGLLVPVACSTTHVGYQMVRVEPTFIALGEATGIAAAESIRQGREVRAIRVEPVQREILKRGGIILFEKDRDVNPFGD